MSKHVTIEGNTIANTSTKETTKIVVDVDKVQDTHILSERARDRGGDRLRMLWFERVIELGCEGLQMLSSSKLAVLHYYIYIYVCMLLDCDPSLKQSK